MKRIVLAVFLIPLVFAATPVRAAEQFDGEWKGKFIEEGSNSNVSGDGEAICGFREKYFDAVIKDNIFVSIIEQQKEQREFKGEIQEDGRVNIWGAWELSSGAANMGIWSQFEGSRSTGRFGAQDSVAYREVVCRGRVYMARTPLSVEEVQLEAEGGKVRTLTQVDEAARLKAEADRKQQAEEMARLRAEIERRRQTDEVEKQKAEAERKRQSEELASLKAEIERSRQTTKLGGDGGIPKTIPAKSAATTSARTAGQFDGEWSGLLIEDSSYSVSNECGVDKSAFRGLVKNNHFVGTVRDEKTEQKFEGNISDNNKIDVWGYWQIYGGYWVRINNEHTAQIRGKFSSNHFKGTLHVQIGRSDICRANIYLRRGSGFETAEVSDLIKAVETGDLIASQPAQPSIPVKVETERERQPEELARLRPDTSGFSETPIQVNFKKGPARPDDIAVIIGNANYRKTGGNIPNVTPAYADAAGIKYYVTEVLGIKEGNIISLKDASQAQFISVFGSEKNYKGKVFNWIMPGESRVFIFYSGHGAPGGADGWAYMVPSDADASTIELNGYSLDTLYRNLSKLPAKSVTVVLEACFSGAAEGGVVISNTSPVYLKAKTPSVPANLTVIAAGGPKEMASWEQDKSHGLFTKYFLKGMGGEADVGPYGNGDGKVSWEELRRYFKRTLTYYARRYYGRDQTAAIVVGSGR
jgi:hypothetical protein